MTAGFHVIGDAAVAAAVDAFDAVVAKYGAVAVARCGHRLEHVEMVTEEQAAKLGSWGVIASMQPGFDALWGGESGMYAQRLGIERARPMNHFALLASQGVPLAFGSDTPVTDMNPWAAVRAATRHHTTGSAISARAAFSAATRGAWRAGGCATASPAHWFPVPRRPTRSGTPTSSTSPRPPTRSSAGPPIRARECPFCPDWTTVCRAVGRPSTAGGHPWLSRWPRRRQKRTTRAGAPGWRGSVRPSWTGCPP